MWPPSLEAANQIGWWANFFLICSLVVGVISTIGVVVTTAVKEGYWDSDRIESAERIAGLSTQADQLRKDTAVANARAEEAKLALVKLKEPRGLKPDQFDRLLTTLKSYDGLSIALRAGRTDDEAYSFFLQLRTLFVAAGWEIHITGITTPAWESATGILITEVKGASEKYTAAAQAIRKGLLAEGIQVPLPVMVEEVGNPTFWIRIVIGHKPI